MLLLKTSDRMFNISLDNLLKIEDDFLKIKIKYIDFEVDFYLKEKVDLDDIYFKLKDIENDYEIIEYNEFIDILEGKRNV